MQGRLISTAQLFNFSILSHVPSIVEGRSEGREKTVDEPICYLVRLRGETYYEGFSLAGFEDNCRVLQVRLEESKV